MHPIFGLTLGGQKVRRIDYSGVPVAFKVALAEGFFRWGRHEIKLVRRKAHSSSVRLSGCRSLNRAPNIDRDEASRTGQCWASSITACWAPASPSISPSNNSAAVTLPLCYLQLLPAIDGFATTARIRSSNASFPGLSARLRKAFGPCGD